jgi:hypothetical protein
MAVNERKCTLMFRQRCSRLPLCFPARASQSPRPNPLAETETQQMPPQPRIEEHPAVELKDLRSQEEKILTTYGWTDKDKGIVRVPIDRAMELRLQQGFPTKPGSQREKQNGR